MCVWHLGILVKSRNCFFLFLRTAEECRIECEWDEGKHEKSSWESEWDVQMLWLVSLWQVGIKTQLYILLYLLLLYNLGGFLYFSLFLNKFLSCRLPSIENDQRYKKVWGTEKRDGGVVSSQVTAGRNARGGTVWSAGSSGPYIKK